MTKPASELAVFSAAMSRSLSQDARMSLNLKGHPSPKGSRGWVECHCGPWQHNPKASCMLPHHADEHIRTKRGFVSIKSWRSKKILGLACVLTERQAAKVVVPCVTNAHQRDKHLPAASRIEVGGSRI